MPAKLSLSQMISKARQNAIISKAEVGKMVEAAGPTVSNREANQIGGVYNDRANNDALFPGQPTPSPEQPHVGTAADDKFNTFFSSKNLPFGHRAEAMRDQINAFVASARQGSGTTIKPRIDHLPTLDLMPGLFDGPRSVAHIDVRKKEMFISRTSGGPLPVGVDALPTMYFGPFSIPAKPLQGGSPEAIEREVTTALVGGYGAVAAQAAELRYLMETSRMVQEAKDLIEVQVSVLDALAQGKAGLESKVGEIRDTMTVALLDERQLKNMNLTLDVLDRGIKRFAPLESRIEATDSIRMRAMLSPDASMQMNAEQRALRAFVHGGGKIDGEIADLEHSLVAGTLDPSLEHQVSLDLVALKAVKGGLSGVREAITQLKNQMMVSRYSPEGLVVVTRQMATLEALEKPFAKLAKQVGAIG